ncbi:hypothetical protein OHA37_21610 [Streptomyces sp. NBC_00335]|uniref:hypothetical protein n=1 Tax=unclassified Streptomyces TaxID=2593676 RepID=UPI002250CCB1|nr:MULTISPECIES: hypothetical protein [unclassified Streptomyces]MCX5406460.1 hypothetical protein [Streptomyces sp. NBC_00086]
MSTDIRGFIECHLNYREHEADSLWHATIALEHLNVPRNYGAFGCLFGVCDDGQFVPVVPVRGLPAGASDRVREGHETTGGRSASWVSWAEIKRVDWDEESAEPDCYIHEYHRDPQGEWQIHQRHYSAPRRFAELCGQPANATHPGRYFPEGSQWIDGDRMFRVERLTSRDAVLDEEWGSVWAVMGTLAELHGDDAVRLVVWFDD